MNNYKTIAPEHRYTRPNLDVLVIKDVLDTAAKLKLSLPETVTFMLRRNAWALRTQRSTQRSTKYTNPKIAEHVERVVARLKTQNRRLRRLRKQYASWRVAAVVAK